MPNLGKTHMFIALKYFVNKFMLRDMAYKVLKNRTHEVEKDIIQIWKETFGFLTPSMEAREGQDVIEFEEEYKQELAKLIEEIQKLVS